MPFFFTSCDSSLDQGEKGQKGEVGLQGLTGTPGKDVGVSFDARFCRGLQA